MEDRDQISGIVLLLFGVAILLGTVRYYPIGSGSAPGPGFFPLIISLFITGLSVNLIVQSFRRGKKRSPSTPMPFFPEQQSFTRVFYAFASLICFSVLLPILGFAPIAFLFCLFLSFFLGHYSFWVSLCFSIGTAVVAYLVFQVWLMVQFPLGILGI
jgi:putative tricarboxylic transport membrane protein